MKIVLVSSITGQNIDSCIKNAIEERNHENIVLQNGGNRGVYSLEDYVTDTYEGHSSLMSILKEPKGKIKSIASKAISGIIDDIHRRYSNTNGENIAFITLHTVFYHGNTQSFISPYTPSKIRKEVGDRNINISSVISIHDDIYDIHSRLLGRRQLFDVTYERSEIKGGDFYPRAPLKDILQQRLLLDWRDRELKASQSLASELSVTHYLCHQKGYLDTFWGIATSDKEPVYYSHPISQPRRDWTQTEEANKCRNPDPERGYKFEQDCQSVADELVESADIPLIDPASIDEFRIDESSTLEFIRSGEYDKHIFPALTRRWTTSNRNDLLEPGASELESQAPYIEVEAFETLNEEFWITDDSGNVISNDDDQKTLQASQKLNGAISTLRDEIKRQIKVRDYYLTDQCPLIVVFRPFTIPLSFESTGGVKDEVKEVIQKHKHDYDLHTPSIIVIHPWEDERKRREKAFKSFWNENGAANEYIKDSEDLKDESLKKSILDICLEEGYDPDTEHARSEIESMLDNRGVQLSAPNSSSSMSSDSYQQGESVWKNFLDDIVGKNSEIFVNGIEALIIGADHCDSEDIAFVDTKEWNIELYDEIREAVGIS